MMDLMVFPRQPVNRPIECVDVSLCREVSDPVVDFLPWVLHVLRALFPESIEVHALSDVPIIVHVGLRFHRRSWELRRTYGEEEEQKHSWSSLQIKK
jgi:hypothetical protein